MCIVKTVFLLLLVLAITLFAARFFLLDRLTTYALNRAGAYDITVHFSDINFKQAQVEVLAATFKLPTGEILPITLTGISLQYTLQQLLTTGKCDQVRIKEMEVHRTGTPKKSGTPPRLPEKIVILKDDLRSRLPLHALKIERLKFYGDLPPQITDKNIQVDTTIKGTTIFATITLDPAANTELTVNLHSPDADHYTADIIGRQLGAEIVQARLALQPDVWSGTVDLQLSPVRNLLLQFADLPGLPEIDGRLDSSFSMLFPLQNNSTIQAEISFHDNKEHRLHLLADGNPITQLLNLTLTGRTKEQHF